ncbi:MAG: DUF3073 domain-containing protein [Propionibacteriaceae bacterium]|jgi:hypothetical protein|nr:DUF3073 domain-containing protein [Propionibacteriaceae bacterium]
MGRGRQKAKQTKVARDLKYRPIDTDFALLARELRGESHDGDDVFDDAPDKWADIAARYEVHDEEAADGAN